MTGLRKNGIKKIIYKVREKGIKTLRYYNQWKYLKAYKRLLSDFGMKIEQDYGYIDPTVYFDNFDYSKISIGKDVTLSREVLFLTHDFSVSTGLNAIGADESGFTVKPIEIGDHCFIGARCTLLGGTKIGSNSIIGAGAVIKGTIAPYSIVVGNPGRIIGDVRDFGRKHLELGEFEKRPKNHHP